jgi:glycogen debranching enzyme
MTDIVRVENEYYVRATSALADDRTRVLKYGDLFGVFNRYGDVEALGPVQFGLFYLESRHLSRMTLRINQRQPLLLSSTIREDNAFLSVDMTNLDSPADSNSSIARGTLHAFRSMFLDEASCYTQLRLANFGLQPVTVTVQFQFDADFVDIFEVRGTQRERHGKRLPADVNKHEVILAYHGLDDVMRRTRLRFSPDPSFLNGQEARFELRLQSKAEATLYVTATCQHDSKAHSASRYYEAYDRLKQRTEMAALNGCKVDTSGKQFNSWIARSAADLDMLTRGNPEGPFPYAGVPWYSTVFGRDSLITALQCLWIAPRVAESVLKSLAKTQGKEEDPERDEEPGRIIHEIRRGEMAALDEVPFGHYYGSVDSTPLFLMLAGAYFQRTNDLELIEEIWPNIEAGLRWIDAYGDFDHDGFVEYRQDSPRGLQQQGWKDSQDSVFHRDGRLADGPIALCEVQGYVYAAKRAIAAVVRAHGKPDLSRKLLREAEQLQEEFEKSFWIPELNTYALALDGKKRQCQVRTSNAGQTLFAGIARRELAHRLARTLFEEDMFSGWGVRTLGASEARYNPMSYHNGSVWPHDNALIGFGLARYGLQRETVQILVALYEASLQMDLQRLPELYCGFHRRPDSGGPTLYPVACAPQAWASGSVYLLLQACMGMEIYAPKKRIVFSDPFLPPSLDELRVESLRIAGAAIDLIFRRYGEGVSIECTRKEGELEVLNFI